MNKKQTKRKKLGIKKRVDGLLKEKHENEKKAFSYIHLRNYLEQKLAEEQQNVKRWKKRLNNFEKALGSLRKMENDLDLFSNVLRSKKKRHSSKTEVEQKKATRTKISYDRLVKKKSELESGIPAIKKLDILTEKKEEIDRRISKLKKETKESPEMSSKIKEKMEKLKETEGERKVGKTELENEEETSE